MTLSHICARGGLEAAAELLEPWVQGGRPVLVHFLPRGKDALVSTQVGMDIDLFASRPTQPVDANKIGSLAPWSNIRQPNASSVLVVRHDSPILLVYMDEVYPPFLVFHPQERREDDLRIRHGLGVVPDIVRDVLHLLVDHVGAFSLFALLVPPLMMTTLGR